MNSVRVISAEESSETAEKIFQGLLHTLVQEGIELCPTSDWESVTSLVASLLTARYRRTNGFAGEGEDSVTITRDELWAEKI